ncbi:hypothetical protein F5B21DRAFT_452342 [Xylaria acuta]|nr:hypothetical protein F5B21DRAFT_452342 [Xylaria acuta]
MSKLQVSKGRIGRYPESGRATLLRINFSPPSRAQRVKSASWRALGNSSSSLYDSILPASTNARAFQNRLLKLVGWPLSSVAPPASSFGLLCRFSDLNMACRRLESFLLDRNSEGVGNMLMIVLDNTDELQNVPGYQSDKPILPGLDSNAEVQNLASWLAENYLPSKQGDTIVLLLGPHELFEDCEAMIGLILSSHETAGVIYYRRLSFCWWFLFAFSVYNDPLKEKDIELDYRFLGGQGELWVTK